MAHIIRGGLHQFAIVPGCCIQLELLGHYVISLNKDIREDQCGYGKHCQAEFSQRGVRCLKIKIKMMVTTAAAKTSIVAPTLIAMLVAIAAAGTLIAAARTASPVLLPPTSRSAGNKCHFCKHRIVSMFDSLSLFSVRDYTYKFNLLEKKKHPQSKTKRFRFMPANNKLDCRVQTWFGARITKVVYASSTT
jgi:hypothetical protein